MTVLPELNELGKILLTEFIIAVSGHKIGDNCLVNNWSMSNKFFSLIIWANIVYIKDIL